ncbi:MAG: hypothetical protein JKY37_15740 [Nannocystaceae bacterium]|nr:hypothetical protein [Nannocystaceae bacterium]
MQRVERIYPVVLGLAMFAAVLSPSLRSPPTDGFPLSNYPMFSRARNTAAMRIAHVVAFDEGGRGRPVAPHLLGSDEVMQARQTVRLAVRAGRGVALDLCHRTVTAMRQAGGSWADAVRVEVRVDTYDAIAYFEGETRPHASRTIASCPVEESP